MSAPPPAAIGARRTRCPGCAVELPPVEGPIHRYLESSPACWAAYGEVLSREYQDPAYGEAHRLTVDAYAVQHPGRPGPQAIRSVGAHLVSLHAVLERGFDDTRATELIRRAVASAPFVWLEPPASRGELTVVSVLAAGSASEHVAAVRAWARSAWHAWARHHPTIHAWATLDERS